MDYKKLVEFFRANTIVPSGLNDNELCAYFMALDHRKNLIVEFDYEFEIIGYCEFYRINYEQLGRIVVHGGIDAREEDTTSGDIAYVNNLIVNPSNKNQGVMATMLSRFLLENFSCNFIAGHSQRKKHHNSYNVYKRTDFISKYLNEGVQNGIVLRG